MSAAKRPPLPAILLANDLLDGDTVFWTGSRWALDHRDALVARDDAVVILLEDAARAGIANQKVVDPYLVDVTLSADGTPVPTHYREKLRTLGPSTRLDLGKQADLRQTADAEI
ncbi:MAG: hypothetical protein JWM36_4080 [Hyphomicrobiales bacterium]|jgi:hypothetical protein|nr:hypothetical protein [Hyphomicrobiales bacterium]